MSVLLSLAATYDKQGAELSHFQVSEISTDLGREGFEADFLSQPSPKEADAQDTSPSEEDLPLDLFQDNESPQNYTLSCTNPRYSNELIHEEPPTVPQDDALASSHGSSDQAPITHESPTRRSSRKPRLPEKQTGDANQYPVNKQSNNTSSTKRKRQPTRGNWSVDHLLTNSESKLASVNLSSLLGHERAWSSLSYDQQLKLIAMLPSTSVHSTSSGEPLPNVLRAHLKSSPAFQADIRLYQEDLAAGRYHPQWQREAGKAMEERANGKFDEWKEQNREEFWGQKQKLHWHAVAGESGQHNLQTLVAADCCRAGDVWSLSRGLGRGKAAVLVEKEARITGVADDYTLSFSFPPGQHKFSASAHGEDKSVSGINGPLPLSNAMLNEDGRIVNVRGANAWREFRCFRNHQDMGSLWDVRELYHQRQGSK